MKGNFIASMLWVSGFSIGAVVVGAIALLYFDKRLANFANADREELLTDVRMAVAQATKSKS